MSAEENKAVVRRFYELFDQGDLDGIVALLDHNFIAHRAGMAPLSRDAFKQHGMTFAIAFTDSTFTLEDLIAENDMVCIRGTWNATHSAELNGIPATGKRIAMGFMTTNRFSNGKIIENWEQSDMLSLMQQLGAIPAPNMD